MRTTSTPGRPPTRLPRSWTVFGAEGAVDVELTVRDDEPLAAVVPALEHALGLAVDGLFDGSARLPDDLPLSAAPLTHGAVLGLGRPAPPAWRAPRSSALELHVVGGPDAGLTQPLGQGRHVVGRGAEAAVPLRDPDVSRRHVLVEVGGGRITVADLESTNGSRLGDDVLDEAPRPWPIGTVLRIGASALTVTGPGQPGGGTVAVPGGRLHVHRVSRPRPPMSAIEVVFPRPPAPPPSRRLAWVAVALPAIAGLLMAWWMNAPTFLFFALLSPIVALGSWLSDRWTGRRSGRREAAAHAVETLAAETRLAAAVAAHARALDAAHPDLATLATAARRRGPLLWSRSPRDTEGLSVRIGTGPGSTGVTVLEGDGTRRVHGVQEALILTDLGRDGGLAVVGPRSRALEVMSGVVAQLTALHPPGQLDLVLLIDPGRLRDWRWSRWLPHLPPGAVRLRSPESDDDLVRWLGVLVAARRPSGAAGGATPGSWLVVLVDGAVDARVAALLRSGRDAGVVVLTTGPSPDALPVGVDAALRLDGETGDTGTLTRTGQPDASVSSVDRLAADTAARFARDLAALAPADTTATLPRSVRLLDLPLVGLRLDAENRISGAWPTTRDHLHAVLGRTAEGPLDVDLCRSGPHALVAGTTGSGKSELLQTLIASLALNHPPDRCSFLLVDYKGGAAFAEAAALPHTVGVVTDLDGQSTARALNSLAAELTRREAILAAHHVADLADLPDSVELARLVIVVDEFATLAEELPGFVPGLVSIAQRGRSLGIHLVLATQRPGGVVSPEIRANCTLRVSLRTTDEADSRDALGVPLAASLPVDLPGRAYIRTGATTPVAVQIARVATGVVERDDRPRATRWSWPFPAPQERDSPEGDTDLRRIAEAVTRHAEGTRVRPPHRPWCPPLPDRLEAIGLPAAGDAAVTRLHLGLLDLPERQAQEPLVLDLADGGTWLVVGGARSGRSTLLRGVLHAAVRNRAPDDLHVHVIETGGGTLAGDATRLPHTGTAISGEDPYRTLRLISRLGDEVQARRAAPGSAAPQLLLLIDGVEQLTEVLEYADPGQGAATLTRLLRDGAAVGLTCVVTADRAVPGGRLAGLARMRLVLPLPDRADYAVAGVSPRAVPEHRPPGRALVGEEALECQLALPCSVSDAPEWPTRSGPPPLRIPDLPVDPVLPSTADGLRLTIGPGGDEGEPLVVDLARTGGLLVAGPPGSGRSSALDAFEAHLRAAGVAVLRPAPADDVGVRDWVAGLGDCPGVLLADDVGSPADWTAIATLAGPARVALIAAAHAGQLTAHYQGPIAALRRARVGLLLRPGPGDAELLGVRLPRIPLPPRPGSGWLVTGGTVERVQVARRREIAG